MSSQPLKTCLFSILYKLQSMPFKQFYHILKYRGVFQEKRYVQLFDLKAKLQVLLLDTIYYKELKHKLW